MRLAAIDIGSNATRLMICEVDDSKSLKKILFLRSPLRLGEDVFDNGHISDSKKDELARIIDEYLNLLLEYRVDKYRTVGTSALREALNSKQILDEIKKINKQNIELISGEEEAQLFITPILSKYKEEYPNMILVDVGGGSTEITLIENTKVINSRSFQIGTVRLMKEKVKLEVWNEIHKWIDEHQNHSIQYQVFCTGGNINTTYKCINKKGDSKLLIEEILIFYHDISRLDINNRMKKYNLNEDRAELIEHSLVIYMHVLGKRNCKQIIIPKISVVDGIIHQLHQN